MEDETFWMSRIEAAISGSGVALRRGPDGLTIGFPEETPVVPILRRAAFIKRTAEGWVATLEPEQGQVFPQVLYTSLDELISTLRSRYGST